MSFKTLLKVAAIAVTGIFVSVAANTAQAAPSHVAAALADTAPQGLTQVHYSDRAHHHRVRRYKRKNKHYSERYYYYQDDVKHHRRRYSPRNCTVQKRSPNWDESAVTMQPWVRVPCY